MEELFKADILITLREELILVEVKVAPIIAKLIF
ncbi:hypothetical protein PDIG_73750 [Penicillium digitatum PHI26]|uniref:Uncharacterized protein n=2 Tax=Penicillium digitatum TaxID=36651 RepID=K9G1E8_PEND2|nr:hypothetical protein PDIP_44230 [Penicillium digitatum Pd1]EKV07101.1 hypothetical protein PDIG_73750 [Penicillium digitatum PHI26]EKV14379.1 hypothetical protein PDIP_44230 [Penicillium digitatum Pd1]